MHQPHHKEPLSGFHAQSAYCASDKPLRKFSLRYAGIPIPSSAVQTLLQYLPRLAHTHSATDKNQMPVLRMDDFSAKLSVPLLSCKPAKQSQSLPPVRYEVHPPVRNTDVSPLAHGKFLVRTRYSCMNHSYLYIHTLLRKGFSLLLQHATRAHRSPSSATRHPLAPTPVYSEAPVSGLS